MEKSFYCVRRILGLYLIISLFYYFIYLFIYGYWCQILSMHPENMHKNVFMGFAASYSYILQYFFKSFGNRTIFFCFLSKTSLIDVNLFDYICCIVFVDRDTV